MERGESSRARRSTGSVGSRRLTVEEVYEARVRADEELLTSTSGGGKLRRTRSSRAVVTRRGRLRRGRGEREEAEREAEAEAELGGDEEEEDVGEGVVEGDEEEDDEGRASRPHGPRLRTDFTAGWDGTQLVLRALIDRFWDTMVSFHMPSYEAGITLTDFAMMSGLPFGIAALDFDVPLLSLEDPLIVEAIGGGVIAEEERDRGTSSIKTRCILDYFEGRGRYHPSDGDDEQNARLWLWWFLSSFHFGDKGERASTLLLPHLMDWGNMGAYD
ncbi:hypothetical protein RND81_01G054900 [Saponaria officinalis]|uniref:Aminotransferase-like plant mobile domain-containing protein n=1 Tax=Saponaria officinalis TaxID=3572 RepID=A0AAW1N635_SAPOF